MTYEADRFMQDGVGQGETQTEGKPHGQVVHEHGIADVAEAGRVDRRRGGTR
jgi:hypothetical protein